MTASADQVHRSGFNGYNVASAACRAGTWLAPTPKIAAPFYAGKFLFDAGGKLDADLVASMTDPLATNRSGYHAPLEAETELVERTRQGPSEYDEEPIPKRFTFANTVTKPSNDSRLSL